MQPGSKKFIVFTNLVPSQRYSNRPGTGVVPAGQGITVPRVIQHLRSAVWQAIPSPTVVGHVSAAPPPPPLPALPPAPPALPPIPESPTPAEPPAPPEPPEAPAPP